MGNHVARQRKNIGHFLARELVGRTWLLGLLFLDSAVSVCNNGRLLYFFFFFEVYKHI